MRFLWYALLIVLPVVLLAALQSHPLWSSASAPAPDAQKLSAPLTRITRAPAVFIETGMEMDDFINSMAFDPDGILWLSSLEGSVYLYSIPTNEVVHLLFPEYVYGLFADSQGIWVLTSHTAFLYRNQIRVRTVIIPGDAKLLCGATLGENVLFGTTEGLYQAGPKDMFATASGSKIKINQMQIQAGKIVMAADDGIYEWQNGQVSRTWPIEITANQKMLVSVNIDRNEILAASQHEGLIMIRPGNFRSVLFAKRSLNVFQPASAVRYKGNSYFGTSSGYLVRYSKNKWIAYEAGEGGISALAASEKALYLWCNGKLLKLEEG